MAPHAGRRAGQKYAGVANATSWWFSCFEEERKTNFMASTAPFLVAA
jgi:hypothetical protein